MAQSTCRGFSHSRFGDFAIVMFDYVGGDWNMDLFLFQKQLGISSSQLTNSCIFQRGRAEPPTSFDDMNGPGTGNVGWIWFEFIRDIHYFYYNHLEDSVSQM